MSGSNIDNNFSGDSPGFLQNYNFSTYYNCTCIKDSDRIEPSYLSFIRTENSPGFLEDFTFFLGGGGGLKDFGGWE